MLLRFRVMRPAVTFDYPSERELFFVEPSPSLQSANVQTSELDEESGGELNVQRKLTQLAGR